MIMDLESLIKEKLYNWSKSMDYTKYLMLNITPEYSSTDELLNFGYLGFKGKIDNCGIDGIHYISTDFLHFINKNKGINFYYELIEIGEYSDIYLDFTRVKIQIKLEGFKITLLERLDNNSPADILFLSNENLINNEFYIDEFIYLKPTLLNNTSYFYKGYISNPLLVLNSFYINKLSVLYIENEVDFNNFMNILKSCNFKFKDCIIQYKWVDYNDFMMNFNFIKFMSLRAYAYKNIKIIIYNFHGDVGGLSHDLTSNHLNNVILSKNS